MVQLVHGARGVIPRQRRSGVELWWAPLDLPATELAALRRHLSASERGRATALRRARDRDRFTAARGWLRQLLAAELDCAPADVLLETAPGGKPEVAGSDLCFSTARSDELALFAIAHGTEVGVDVEAIGPEADIDRVAALFFSPSERRALAALPPKERAPAAFSCWTCKEAYFKGVGTGLIDGVRDVTTWTGNGQPTSVGDWQVREVDVASGFAAAVAIQNGTGVVVEVQGAPFG